MRKILFCILAVGILLSLSACKLGAPDGYETEKVTPAMLIGDFYDSNHEVMASFDMDGTFVTMDGYVGTVLIPKDGKFQMELDGQTIKGSVLKYIKQGIDFAVVFQASGKELPPIFNEDKQFIIYYLPPGVTIETEPELPEAPSNYQYWGFADVMLLLPKDRNVTLEHGLTCENIEFDSTNEVVTYTVNGVRVSISYVETEQFSRFDGKVGNYGNTIYKNTSNGAYAYIDSNLMQPERTFYADVKFTKTEQIDETTTAIRTKGVLRFQFTQDATNGSLDDLYYTCQLYGLGIIMDDVRLDLTPRIDIDYTYFLEYDERVANGHYGPAKSALTQGTEQEIAHIPVKLDTFSIPWYDKDGLVALTVENGEFTMGDITGILRVQDGKVSFTVNDDETTVAIGTVKDSTPPDDLLLELSGADNAHIFGSEKTIRLWSTAQTHTTEPTQPSGEKTLTGAMRNVPLTSTYAEIIDNSTRGKIGSMKVPVVDGVNSLGSKLGGDPSKFTKLYSSLEEDGTMEGGTWATYDESTILILKDGAVSWVKVLSINSGLLYLMGDDSSTKILFVYTDDISSKTAKELDYSGILGTWLTADGGVGVFSSDGMYNESSQFSFVDGDLTIGNNTYSVKLYEGVGRAQYIIDSDGRLLFSRFL